MNRNQVFAATAIGLSLSQYGWTRKVGGVWISTWPVTSRYSDGYPSTRWVLPTAGRVAPFLPCLVAWTGAFLVIRLRGLALAGGDCSGNPVWSRQSRRFRS